MSDMCFEDFDYDREDDLYSQAAELEEEKLTSDNNERDDICLECAGSGRRYFAYGTKEGVVCKWCEGTGKRSPIS